MRILLTLFKHFSFFILLTVITQIGGIVYLFTTLIFTFIKCRYKLQKLLIFSILYLITTLIIIPPIARQFGREPVPYTDRIRPTNYATVLLNRNYITPRLNQLLQTAAKDPQLIKNNIEIRYLDACFPFIKGFPLLPHLSHNDGRKIDVSLVYQTTDNQLTNRKKSISGYGVFAHPNVGESDQIAVCKKKGYWQYDFPKFFTFGSINSDLQFSDNGTKNLINSFLKQKGLGKIFIEPHLKQRLRLSDSRIWYHGCQSVRHDDHIHVQL